MSDQVNAKLILNEKILQAAKRKGQSPIQFALERIFNEKPHKVEVFSSMAFLYYKQITWRVRFSSDLRNYLTFLDLKLPVKGEVFDIELEEV